MQIGICAAGARNGHCEADQIVAVERAENLSADLCGNDKQAKRNQIHIVEIPHLFLQSNAGFEFADAMAGTDDGNPYLLFLACWHNASISSSEAVSSLLPRSLSLDSTY